MSTRSTERLALDKKLKHDIELVVDRLVVKEGIRSRLTDSVETALQARARARSSSPTPTRSRRSGRGSTPRSTRSTTASSRSRTPATPAASRFGELAPQNFSFNSPLGSCPECQGLGTRAEMDPDLIIPDPSLTIRDGAVEPWASGMERGEGWTFEFVEHLSRSLGLDLDTPWSKLPKQRPRPDPARQRRRSPAANGLPHRSGRAWSTSSAGASSRPPPRPCAATTCASSPTSPARPAAASGSSRRAARCAMRGRGHRRALAPHHRRRRYAWLTGLELKGNEARIADELLKEIRNRLRFLLDVGLGYLTLDRPGPSLSGGESQRIRLASQMGRELTGVIYILDEPSIGLHQRDNGKLLATLKRLRDMGNSVIVVEHDEETMVEADWLVDFGPGAGAHGGEVVGPGHAGPGAAGPGLAHRRVPLRPRARSRCPSAGARRPRGDLGGGRPREQPEGPDRLLPARAPGRGHRRLRGGQVHAGERGAAAGAHAPPATPPARCPGSTTGSWGIELIDKVIDINQQPIGRTPRSNPATYTKLFDRVREVFAQTPEARALGYQPGRFSFNVKGGRCEACQGDGMKLVEMHFLADVLVPCEVCGGKRFNEATLRVTFKGKNIAEVLDLSVTEAMELFQHHREIARMLRTLEDVGLGYIKLGPALPDPLRRRGPAHQALARAGPGRHGQDPLHPRRAHHRPPLRRREAAAARPRPAGRRRQHGGGDRAQPRRDQVRRLGHRPGPRGRRRGRPDHRRGHARGGGPGQGAATPASTWARCWPPTPARRRPPRDAEAERVSPRRASPAHGERVRVLGASRDSSQPRVDSPGMSNLDPDQLLALLRDPNVESQEIAARPAYRARRPAAPRGSSWCSPRPSPRRSRACPVRWPLALARAAAGRLAGRPAHGPGRPRREGRRQGGQALPPRAQDPRGGRPGAGPARRRPAAGLARRAAARRAGLDPGRARRARGLAAAGPPRPRHRGGPGECSPTSAACSRCRWAWSAARSGAPSRATSSSAARRWAWRRSRASGPTPGSREARAQNERTGQRVPDGTDLWLNQLGPAAPAPGARRGAACAVRGGGAGGPGGVGRRSTTCPPSGAGWPTRTSCASWRPAWTRCRSRRSTSTSTSAAPSSTASSPTAVEEYLDPARRERLSARLLVMADHLLEPRRRAAAPAGPRPRRGPSRPGSPARPFRSHGCWSRRPSHGPACPRRGADRREQTRIAADPGAEVARHGGGGSASGHFPCIDPRPRVRYLSPRVAPPPTPSLTTDVVILVPDGARGAGPPQVPAPGLGAPRRVRGRWASGSRWPRCARPGRRPGSR